MTITYLDTSETDPDFFLGEVPGEGRTVVYVVTPDGADDDAEPVDNHPDGDVFGVIVDDEEIIPGEMAEQFETRVTILIHADDGAF